MEVIHHTSTEAARDTLALIHYKVEGNDEKFKKHSKKPKNMLITGNTYIKICQSLRR